MNAKISVFIICDEAIIYLLLYNLYDCNFNGRRNYFFHACKAYLELLQISLMEFFTTIQKQLSGGVL